MAEEIETKTEIISLRKDGIVHCIALPDAYITLEDAKENIQAINKVAGGIKSPVLVDIRKSSGAAKEARKYFSSPEVATVQSAVAMLIDSGFSKLMGNFFIGLNKPLFPLKLFTNMDEALEWLAGYSMKKDEKTE